ncbi:hypothetical protein HMPREF2646_09230, partial [Enterococcus sp. HMSC069A01]|uniref:hypothetical protein n=1 Tax=Enterococcus sp. HMSC069A01 TaxID=1715125 RepID=UPI0008A51493
AVFGKTGEPQKHVMPKFFDKWVKQVLEKRDKFYAISLIARAGWGYGVDYELGESENPSTTRELLDWLVEDSLYLNKEKATEALLYGYEVEESKWVVNEGDLVIRKGEHEAKVYFVESVDDDGILLVNGIKDEFFTDLYDRSVGEESINYFYENFRLLAKKENLEAEKVEV